MAISKRLKDSGQSIVTSNFSTQINLVELNDDRLERLIAGTRNSINEKRRFLVTHNWPQQPEHKKNYKEKLEASIKRLEARLQELLEEKRRRIQ